MCVRRIPFSASQKSLCLPVSMWNSFQLETLVGTSSFSTLSAHSEWLILQSPLKPGLYLVGTTIDNLEDITSQYCLTLVIRCLSCFCYLQLIHSGAIGVEKLIVGSWKTWWRNCFLFFNFAECCPCHEYEPLLLVSVLGQINHLLILRRSTQGTSGVEICKYDTWKLQGIWECCFSNMIWKPLWWVLLACHLHITYRGCSIVFLILSLLYCW